MIPNQKSVRVTFRAGKHDQRLLRQVQELSKTDSVADAIRAALESYVSQSGPVAEPPDATMRAWKAVVREALREHEEARGRRRRTLNGRDPRSEISQRNPNATTEEPNDKVAN